MSPVRFWPSAPDLTTRRRPPGSAPPLPKAKDQAKVEKELGKAADALAAGDAAADALAAGDAAAAAGDGEKALKECRKAWKHATKAMTTQAGEPGDDDDDEDDDLPAGRGAARGPPPPATQSHARAGPDGGRPAHAGAGTGADAAAFPVCAEGVPCVDSRGTGRPAQARTGWPWV
ncbi:MAG: hypothetical protein FJZ92_04340 [Chloroflexi bacterium]|nr:hypothetical protein [Chloroflexota bacterium]